MMSLRNLGIMLAVGAAAACSGSSAEPLPARTEPVADAAAPSVAAVPPATVERVTPILAVEAIEPVVPFWEALGFTATNPARQDGALIFVGLTKDGLAVHYQTNAHIENTIPAASNLLKNTTALVYLTVDDLDAIVAGLGDAEVVVPRRRTEWGADEIYVKGPGGNIIGFAAYGG